MQNLADEITSEMTAATDAGSDERDSSPSGDNGATGSTGDGDDSSSQSRSTGEDDGAPHGTGSPSAEKTVPLKALEDEREKRQYERQLREAQERRIAELEARITAVSSPKADEPSIDFDKVWEDPKSVFEAHEKAITSKSRAQTMEMSREMARAHFEDYDETIEKLSSMHVPGLEEAVAKSPTPAFTAYRMIKKHERDMLTRAEPPELKKIKDELEQARRELAEMRGERHRPPVNLSQARSATGGSSKPVRTQDEILAAAWDRPLRARK